ncbi:two-component sensor histidine kinase [Paraliobacillus quinghaiensis]|uniref:histidine kinase n=1 Tax=Paraliobacillus quinghaiensis TaxID=470815 RepID=A0A917TMV2_9BACI|nr:HAMP domain-containing sensor histidine kinase [Paraliobacillus quinghaiensis]GGM29478.1 two-component sensor histidine kinase [Paraliobacillus quinghaiensis]
MKKISFKLGISFLIVVLILESLLFFFLYLFIVKERVESETDNLLGRGMNHRDVLEKNFNIDTIEHVALMESEAETKVVIANEKFKIIDASHDINQNMKQLISKGRSMDFSHHGILVESRWASEPYLATISPIIIDGSNEGYVYMFADTNPIRTMIKNITLVFVVIDGIAIIISIITIFFLSQFITQPLIKMKEATEKITKRDNDVILDIHRDDELGELARAIYTLSNELEYLKNERTEFLSSVSHELRTPLTYLKGYADILNRSNLPAKDREKFASIIQEEATHLAEMVKELFLLAKMDKNQFLIHKKTIPLCYFLQDIISKLKPAFTEKNIRLQLTCAKDVNVNIDPIRFRQVINNLLDNARKYASEYTSVKVSAYEQEDNVVIEITDQGEGIPEKDIPYIWERLYRVDKSRSRALGGRGLGLAIVKEIIERHGGTVNVKSLYGEGTTFTIKIKKWN